MKNLQLQMSSRKKLEVESVFFFLLIRLFSDTAQMIETI